MTIISVITIAAFFLAGMVILTLAIRLKDSRDLIRLLNKAIEIDRKTFQEKQEELITRLNNYREYSEKANNLINKAVK